MHFFKSFTKNKKFIHFSTIPQKKTKENQHQETHQEVLLRILFIFAKTNSGIKYVQGMNELLAPIYYCFSQDPNPEFREYVEEDSFFCFLKIMASFQDNFIKSLDKSRKGIYTRLQLFNNKLKQVDPQIQAHFVKLEVIPEFYCMRWIMLGFTQEFELLDLLRL